MYNFIAEVCTNYDIDGVELDFMRDNMFFRVQDTTVAQRKAIISEFVARLRTLLESTAAAGRHRWLLVRIPAFTSIYDSLGIDVAQMSAAGADMFTLSHNYPSYQQSDMAKVCSLVPDKAVYIEMTHTSAPPARASIPLR
jgi:hypothetical protein